MRPIPLVAPTAVLLVMVGHMAAAAETATFKSAVVPEKWSATVRGTLTFPPGKGPHPTVVILHSCGGLSPPDRASHSAHTSFLVRHGFATYVPDSFGVRGLSGGKACRGAEPGPAGPYILLDDAFNAMAALQKNGRVDGRNVFLVGQSLGGGAALMAATEDYTTRHDAAFRAIVAYYPSNCDRLSFTPKLKNAQINSPLLIFAAGRDDWTPVAPCQTAKDRVGARTFFDVVVYPDALHAFDQPRRKTVRFLGHALGYNARATADSRRRMLEFFKRHLVR